MDKLHSRARACAPMLALALAACSQPQAQARLEARQGAMDRPSLWLAQALDTDGRVAAAIEVCADGAMRDGFARADAEVNGRPCHPRRDGVERRGLFAVRCEIDERRFGLTVNRRGDPARAFTVSFALTALDGSGVGARQVRRFQRLGPCPAGWRIGDQRRPGGERGVNALAGTWTGE